MATTTNYSWSTPDDTALVKDGAAAIRSLGTAIDSTVFTNAGAAINKTIIDAKGDLIVGSAADTAARLAVGVTNGHVLTVNSGATNGVEWASPAGGGMTLISTTTLSGATTTLSSIPQTYNSLYLVIQNVTGNTSDALFRCLPNNVDNLSAYQGLIAGVSFEQTAAAIRLAQNNTLRTNSDNAWVLIFENYTSTTGYKPFEFYGFYVKTGTTNETILAGGAFRSNTAITSLVFDYGGTNTFAGGTVRLYGVK